MDWVSYEVSPNSPSVEQTGGMKKADASRLLAFCQGAYCRKLLMVIVRGSKPKSLAHHFKDRHYPKPITEKAKIPASTGVLQREEGNLISDYDLQGVYELRDTAYYRLYVSNGAHSTFEGPLDNRFLAAINQFVRPTQNPAEAFFQHGPNDDYLDQGRPKNEGIGDVFLAFLPDGKMYLLPDRNTLKQFYHRQRISWNYSV